MDIVVTRINKAGGDQVWRESELLQADAGVLIGRGRNCQLVLDHVSVELEHARLEALGDEILLKKVAGSITINGAELRHDAGRRLEDGQTIVIGIFEILVVKGTDGASLGLEIGEPQKSSVPQRARIAPHRLSKRCLAYQAFFWTLLGFLLLPVALERAASDRPNAMQWIEARFELKPYQRVWIDDKISSLYAAFMRTWEPGPLMRPHRVTQGDCKACHAEPFGRIRNHECQHCHTSIRDHVPLEAYSSEGRLIADRRCSRCHLDHVGEQREPYPQRFCVQCHGTIKEFAADGGDDRGNVRNFGAFTDDHAEFRVSIEDPGQGRGMAPTQRRVRLGQPADKLGEKSNLKFPHKLHLGELKGPDDKKSRQLDCKDCHKPDETGMRMAPIRMTEHCQDCHRLAFEPALTDREVPHGDEKAMMTTLREFYARLMLGELPDGLRTPEIAARDRPGRALSPEDRSRVLEVAERKTRLALQELYWTRQVCSTCHEIERAASTPQSPPWRVKKVHLTRHWMPYAQFTHAKHQQLSDKSTCAPGAKDCGTLKELSCTYCHDVKNSTKSSDVAMPSIKVCAQCHGGADAPANRVRSECATCHLYHGVHDMKTAKQRQTMTVSPR